MFSAAASPCQRIDSKLFPGLQVWVKRDDLLHPLVSGNKFRKLKYPLLALNGRRAHLVSMGGIWSNHLHALAHAAVLHGHSATLLVRAAPGMDSAMLEDCRALGMQVQYVSRDDYRRLREEPDAWRHHVMQPGPQHVWLPEGGSAAAALHGVAELADEAIAQLGFVPDQVALACGTGATLAGVLAGLAGRSQVLGVAALRQAEYLHRDIARLQREAGYPVQQNYQLLTQFHHGGYAKISPALSAFCQRFAEETGILPEPVYTGKMFYALHQLALENVLPAGSRVLAVHTGGLQGLRGWATSHQHPSPEGSKVQTVRRLW